MNEETTNIDAKTLLRTSRIAGAWYLLLGIMSPLGLMYVPSNIIIPGDATATAANILSQEFLLRLGIASTFMGQIAFLLAALAFKDLFRRVDRGQATMMLTFVVASVPISFLSMLGEIAALLLLKGQGQIPAFTPAQIQALALTGMELSQQGILIAGIFWGLWLLPLGILVIKSGWFPKIFGILLLIGFGSYILDSILAFIFPGQRHLFATPLSITMALGEIPFLLWLVIRGARVKGAKATMNGAEQRQ